MINISMISSGLHFDKVLGVIMITLVSLLIGINLLYVMLLTVISSYRKLKLRWNRHQAQKTQARVSLLKEGCQAPKTSKKDELMKLAYLEL